MNCWCCEEADCGDCSNLRCEYDADHCVDCCDCERLMKEADDKP